MVRFRQLPWVEAFQDRQGFLGSNLGSVELVPGLLLR